MRFVAMMTCVSVSPISMPQSEVSSHLDILGRFEAVKLVEQFQHSPLHLRVATARS